MAQKELSNKNFVELKTKMAKETYTDSMNLKVRELLKEVQFDYSPANTKLVEDIVSSIKEAIDKIPDGLQVTKDVAPGFVKDVGADKVEFKFKKPVSIEIGGSYAYRGIAKPDVNIDLLILLPKECFHEKDYLNYRYHAKRCLYLCIIKKYLKFSSLVQKVEWSTFQNEARKPILVFYPDVKFAETPICSVRLIPAATSLFSISKLNMQRNNIRALNQGILHATPIYNHSILEDMHLEDNAKFITSTFSGWKELCEALILLKVWVRQRSSLHAHDCLSGYLLSIILTYLATASGRNRITKTMNMMQIFRITLGFIATSESWKKGIFFKSLGKNNISEEEERKIYPQSFPAVVCDPFGQFNMAFRMSESGLQELQDEAALAVSCMDKCRDGGFDEIFITNVDFAAKFDQCIRVNLKGNAEVYASGFCLDNECWRSYEHKIHSLMQEALGNRVKLVRAIWRNTVSECNIEDGLSMYDREVLLIGILLNSEEAFKKVIKGPSPENRDEARKFQRFWGEKAELRHIDRVNTECAVWDCKPWEAHLIIKWITEHILMRHLSLSKENIMHVVDQLDFPLVLGHRDPTSFAGHLLKAFNDLSTRLRQLNNIPLKISSVQPLDSAFRCTSACPPLPHPLASDDNIDRRTLELSSTCIQPVDVLIQLEGSGKWPVDDVAIEKTKSAFLLKIGESLQKSWKMKFSATEEDMNVIFSGYAFRLKILHERGLSLVNRQHGSDQSKRISSTDRKLFLQSQHSSMINGLRGRYPIFEPVVRLAKRWIAAHLFSATLAAEAIELLAAHLFLKPLPFSAPCSRITAFLRFLRLLLEHDWTFSPLIVDINGDLTPDDEKDINDNFKSSRKTYEEEKRSISPAMFLATTYDKASEAWTRSSPSSLELRRLVAYARSSSNLLTKLMLRDQLDSYGWECIFRTPLNNYDAVILLHRDKLPYPERLLFPSELNQGRLLVSGKASKLFQPFISGDAKANIEELKEKVMVDFDPLRCFIEDLETKFPNILKVWYDSFGGDSIGLTWEKEGLKKRGRDVGEDESNLLDELKAVGDVGKGFVRSIYSLKAPRLHNQNV